MALTRKLLATMGIEPEKAEEIIAAHVETVDALKAERDSFRGKAENADKYKGELDEAKAKLEELDSSDYRAKFDAVKTEFEKYKTEQQKAQTLALKDTAYRAMLKNAGVSEKRIDAVMKVTNLENIELDGENLKNAEELAKTVKTEWADFITTEEQHGAETETPAGTDGGTKPTKIPSIF